MSLESPFASVPITDLVLNTETRDPQRGPDVPFQYIDIASVCNQRFEITSPKIIAASDAPSRARKVIRENDVIFATTRPYLKSIATVPNYLNDQICSTGFCVLRAGSRVLPDWIFYCVISDEFNQQITPLMRGANYPAVTDKDVRSAKIPVPPLDEQRRIVGRIKECLSRAEEIEALRYKSIADAGYLASSLYAAIANSDEWPSKSVGEVITRSRNGKSIRQDNEKSNGHVLSLSAVRDVSLDFSEKKPIVLSNVYANQYRIYSGDVFVSRSNTRELVGLSSVAVNPPDTPLIYPDLLIKLEVDSSQILPRYLAYVLRTQESRRQIKDRAVGTSQSMVKISGERLKEIVIPVPPLDIQVSLVKRFDELHSFTSQLIGEMKSPEQNHLRESILRKAFAGEL